MHNHLSPRVYLVGAGPGDPGLVTLRAAECLARADLILYDYLVNPQILALAAERAERISLGRHGHGKLWTQEEINQRLVTEGRAGRHVVRLKGGDPAVFGHLAEEAHALAGAGIPFEIVPGITAALAAASYAAVPLTDRDKASAVALVTGHEGETKSADTLDYAALARFPGTLVFYMGVTTAGVWSRALMAAGRSGDTPAIIVRRVSWPQQRSVRCRLDEVAGLLDQTRADKIRPPAIVIVGDVAAVDPSLEWFNHRPLFGRKILVTRAADQAGVLRGRLAEMGADVLVQPAIEIAPPEDWRPMDGALARLNEFDWVVFSSTNGVRSFLERLWKFGDVRLLSHAKLAAIGSGTAAELAGWKLKADLSPVEVRAEGLVDHLIDALKCHTGPHAARVLLVRASRGRETLAEGLSAAGALVEEVVAYQSTNVVRPDPEVAGALAAGEIHWVTVTSSAIARSLAAMFGAELKKVRLASISPVTSESLRELGYAPAAEARH
jgi:uroporphyrinogen III methyltransferase/synthase